jgi:hypothetical protein
MRTTIPCPTHGDLVLALARGRLADAESRRAESALRDCASCRAWWQGSLDHPDVARGVADGLAAFRPPAARPAARPWALRAAAALVLVAGGAAAWLAGPGRPVGDVAGGVAPAGREAAPAAGVIVAEGLESGAPGTLQPVVREAEIIFADGLESGDLGAWRSRS